MFIYCIEHYHSPNVLYIQEYVCFRHFIQQVESVERNNMWKLFIYQIHCIYYVSWKIKKFKGIVVPYKMRCAVYTVWWLIHRSFNRLMKINTLALSEWIELLSDMELQRLHDTSRISICEAVNKFLSTCKVKSIYMYMYIPF